MDFKKLFDSFRNLNVAIIGDVMVDSYVYGKVNRISPEAPVPIVEVNKRENRLGGAANVALNIKALGANPIIFSVIGDDEKGIEFKSLLESNSLTSNGLIVDNNRSTTTKFRVIGNNVQLLRVDEENTDLISDEISVKIINIFSKFISENKIDVLIFQDYDKGLISQKLIVEISNLCKANNIPISVDPKKNNFLSYNEVDLFKPNLKELKEGLKIDFKLNNNEAIENALIKLEEIINPKITMLTLSEKGVLIKDFHGIKNYSAHIRNIADVSGAGDTVISIASCCLALNLSSDLIAQISNIGGGLVCEFVGVVPINLELLIKESQRLIK